LSEFVCVRVCVCVCVSVPRDIFFFFCIVQSILQ